MSLGHSVILARCYFQNQYLCKEVVVGSKCALKTQIHLPVFQDDNRKLHFCFGRLLFCDYFWNIEINWLVFFSTDNVPFGEVAMAPPSLSAKPKKAPVKNKVTLPPVVLLLLTLR